VHISTAATTAQGGLAESLMIVSNCTHCINAYPEGCRANCACCGRVRHREETRDYADRNLIRVDWPAVYHEEIIARVEIA
jgi:biotin synthase-related radical SAM superfamily protein